MDDSIVNKFLSNPSTGRLVLSASLKNFIKFFHWYMYRQQFEFLPFHEEIVMRLENIVFGRAEKRNLMINIPPRHGKSVIMKYFCAWSYMINSQSNCIYTSYSDDLVNNFSKEIRAVITSEAFQKLTGMKLDKSKTGADYWGTLSGGGFRAAPMGGSIVGFGFGWSGEGYGGCCLIDDPNKPTRSQIEFQNTIDDYLKSIKTRANNQEKSPMILIMQRLALEDLAGYILENELDDWEVIKMPALNEETGEALWEKRVSAKELLKMKEATPFIYYGAYQQEPIVVGGSVIKTDWFRYYDTNQKYDYQFTFITSDTAMKIKEANDFSVFAFWGKTYDNRLHLIDAVRGKWEADGLREQIKLCWEKWSKFDYQPYGFYIEDKSSGIGVIQELRKTYPMPIIPVTRARHKNENGQYVSVDKLSRAMTAAPYLANGWVYLPNNEKDVISSQLLSECAAFRADMGHKHDDFCDVLFDAVDIAFSATGISSIFI